jgi:hypothetical protein
MWIKIRQDWRLILTSIRVADSILNLQTPCSGDYIDFDFRFGKCNYLAYSSDTKNRLVLPQKRHTVDKNIEFKS